VNGDAINNRYLETFLATRTAYEQLVGGIHGATRPRINTTQLKECQVPIPPATEQFEIVLKLSAMLSVAEVAEAQIDANLRRADRLRQSILKQAFSGALV
jgi:type I restriction enzyme S subunit